MQFNQNANLVTVDGKLAGHVDRVVINPGTKEITHVIMRRGLLQKKDKVVPIGVVTTEPAGQLCVHLKDDELDFLPDFVEERYIMLEDSRDRSGPSAILQTPQFPGGVSGVANFGPAFAKETHVNIPDQAVALREGAKVISLDDKEVGHVVQMLTNPTGDQVTHFLVARGMLVKEHRLIPTTWVDRLTDDAVYLAIDSGTMDRLPVVEAA
jgi:uncharacterized protein YrrD